MLTCVTQEICQVLETSMKTFLLEDSGDSKLSEIRQSGCLDHGMLIVGYCLERGLLSRTGRTWVSDRLLETNTKDIVTGLQFHIMRDGPFHLTVMLAGLWGANNYLNMTRAAELRHRLLQVRVDQWKFYDQKILKTRVWPHVRRHATVHDSYNCYKNRTMGPMSPWPMKREGFLYCGSGPTKVTNDQ